MCYTKPLPSLNELIQLIQLTEEFAFKIMNGELKAALVMKN